MSLTSDGRFARQLAIGLVASGICLVAIGIDHVAAFGGLNHQSPAAMSSNPLLHRVQTKSGDGPRLIVDVSAQGKAGDKLKFPARVEPANSQSSQFVMLYQVPPWLKIGGGESVGNGVWLVPLAKLAAAELQFDSSANGRHEVVVALLAPNGSDVQSENRLIVTAASQAAAAPARTWQSLVGAGGGAAAAAPPAPAAIPVAVPSTNNEAELIQYARHLVRECTTCHSVYGTDVGIPVMVGLSRERFIDTMSLYRTGRRDHGPMKAVAEALDEKETLALALYLGRIKPSPVEASRSVPAAPAPGTAAAVVAKRGEEKPERIERWLKRGEELVRNGDIAQARLLLERAAEHGSARGAYLLGTTYDPNTLPWRPSMGLQAQPAVARDWYLYAKQLGTVPEADQRLAELN